MPVTMQEVKTTDTLRTKELTIACFGVGGIATLSFVAGNNPVGAACVAGLPDNGGTIVGVDAVSQVSPTLTAAILDVNNDGTTIFTATTGRVKFPLNIRKGTARVESDFTAAGKKVFNGDMITVDCDSGGSAAAATRVRRVAVTVTIRCDEPND